MNTAAYQKALLIGLSSRQLAIVLDCMRYAEGPAPGILPPGQPGHSLMMIVATMMSNMTIEPDNVIEKYNEALSDELEDDIPF